MKALCFDTFGSPEVLYYGDVAEPTIKADEVLVKTKAIGLNFADVYRRKGNYHLVGQPPFIAGYEGAGEIIKLGKNVKHLNIGDRIGFADVPLANAELVAVPVSHALPLPQNISFETAAAILLQGLTAQYLTTDSYQIKPGDVVLVHAAAGGIGQLLVQLGKHFGATVIGLTSSKAKKQAIVAAGADDVFLYGDKTITGGDLWSYLTSAEERVRRSTILFDWVAKGIISVDISKQFALRDGAAAHAFLESRQSTGKILLIP